MKRLIKSILLGSSLFLLCGCNKLNNATIYTTVYPIEYLTNILYSKHSTISSIYPDGTDVNNYSLTDKQINTYSNGTLFIYNGTTNEKQIAKTFVNKNKQLKIIDAAYSLTYKNGPEELWLSPSNYLMLATNIKDNLESQIGSKYINEEIDTNYKELEENLSIMDAEIRSIANDAKSRGKNTLVVSSNTFKFLTDYGFNVISLEDTNMTTLKTAFKNSTYKYLLVKNTETTNDSISEITKNSGQTIIVNMMDTLTEENKKTNETYFTIMKKFIADLKTITN